MKRWLSVVLLSLLPGCSIAGRSDSFGAGVDMEIGGLLSYVVDLKFKAHIGFYKQHPEGGSDDAIPKEPWMDHPDVRLWEFL